MERAAPWDERVRVAQEGLARTRARPGPRRSTPPGPGSRRSTPDPVLDKSVRDAVVPRRSPAGTQSSSTPASWWHAARRSRWSPTSIARGDLFVPEPLIPRLTLGQRRHVFNDAGGAGIAGTVTFISSRAEFTPRNVRPPRSDPSSSTGSRSASTTAPAVLKQGMPVDAELPCDEAPRRPRRRCPASTAASGDCPDGLVKRYGEFGALRGLTFEVQRAEIRPHRTRRCRQDDRHPPDVRTASPRRRDGARARRRSGGRSRRHDGAGRLSLAAVQPVRRSQHRREHRFFAEIHGMRDYARRRDELLAMTQLTPFRSASPIASRGDEAEAGAGVHADPPADLLLLDEPRRSTRCRGASSGSCCRVPGRRHHDSDVDAVSRRGRALLTCRTVHEGRCWRSMRHARCAPAAGRMLEVIVGADRGPRAGRRFPASPTRSGLASGSCPVDEDSDAAMEAFRRATMPRRGVGAVRRVRHRWKTIHRRVD